LRLITRALGALVVDLRLTRLASTTFRAMGLSSGSIRQLPEGSASRRLRSYAHGPEPAAPLEWPRPVAHGSRIPTDNAFNWPQHNHTDQRRACGSRATGDRMVGPRHCQVPTARTLTARVPCPESYAHPTRAGLRAQEGLLTGRTGQGAVTLKGCGCLARPAGPTGLYS
jgi:hypothetical protein